MLNIFGPRWPIVRSLSSGYTTNDGCQRYAARQRNLACRPFALGRHHGAHESLPLTATNQPAGTTPAQPTNLATPVIASKPSTPPGRTITSTFNLYCPRGR
jgi:hypothetical protein